MHRAIFFHFAHIAVLGCGISTAYPKEHKTLMDAIARHGAVITEYPPNEPPRAHNFPKRNRIISGLCQGVVVIEGPTNSGAMITARRAIDQGREVFALPGKIDDNNSDGPNELIREGAYAALCSDDILSHYGFLYGDVINLEKHQKAKRRVSGDDADAALRKYGVESRAQMRHAKSVARKKAVAENEISLEARTSESKSEEAKTTNEQRPANEAMKIKSETLTDDSARVLESLDADTRRVFEALPIDKAVSPDSLAMLGIEVGAAITSLTMLELYGLVSSLPGGLYIRK